MNGKRLSAKEFKLEIYHVPAAIPYYKKANSNFYLGFLALACMGTFGLLGKESQDIGSADFGKKKYGFRVAGILSGGAAIYLLIRSNKNLKKAVHIRNTAY